jgi:hypothetical protein
MSGTLRCMPDGNPLGGRTSLGLVYDSATDVLSDHSGATSPGLATTLPTEKPIEGLNTGQSDHDPSRHAATDSVDDLHGLLDVAGVASPYLWSAIPSAACLGSCTPAAIQGVGPRYAAGNPQKRSPQRTRTMLEGIGS